MFKLESIRASANASLRESRHYPAETICATGVCDCKCTSDCLRLVSLCGKGAFASVWRAVDNHGEQFAVKIYKETSGEYIDNYKNEISLLSHLHLAGTSHGHPNVVPFVGAFLNMGFDAGFSPRIYPCVVFGLRKCSVEDLLRQRKAQFEPGLPPMAARKITADILSGLEFVHAAGLVHADIKPANILLDCTPEEFAEICSETRGRGAAHRRGERLYTASIADFGSSTRAESLFSLSVGTLEYCSPEVAQGTGYSAATDIWSAGVTVAELLTGQPLFDVDGLYDETYIAESTDETAAEITDETTAEIVDEQSDTASGCSDTSDVSFEQFSCLLRLVQNLLGAPPLELCVASRFYTGGGVKKYETDEIPLSLGKVVADPAESIEQFLSCRGIDSTVRSSLSRFLSRCLRYKPESRESATELLGSNWARYTARVCGRRK